MSLLEGKDMIEYSYTVDTILNCPKQGIPLASFSVERCDIPLEKDWSKRWCTMPLSYQKHVSRMLNFKTKLDDLWIVTMPDGSNNWMEEIIWMIQQDFDFEKAKSVPLNQRCPLVEMEGLYDDEFLEIESFRICEELPSPRLLKSHLPASLLPKDLWRKRSKIIYIARNVEDAVVSIKPFLEHLNTFHGTKEQFLQAFLNNNLCYTPYWEHIVEFWEMRHESNIFFTSLERMKKDVKNSIRELCEFIGKPIPNDNVIDKMIQSLSI